MPRRKIEYSELYPYHIYGKANNSDWFHIPIQLCWPIFLHYLQRISKKYNFRIHAFVLMNNHFHLVGSTPDNNLPLIMNRLMTEISKKINFLAKRSNHVFGGQYRATIIKNGFHYQHALRYVFQNPVAVNLCKRVEEYPYSIINKIFDDSFPASECEIFEDFIPKDRMGFINLMNEEFTKNQREAIKKAMRKSEYKINKRLKKLF